MVDGMPPNDRAHRVGGPGRRARRGRGQGSSPGGPDPSLACGHADPDAAPAPGCSPDPTAGGGGPSSSPRRRPRSRRRAPGPRRRGRPEATLGVTEAQRTRAHGSGRSGRRLGPPRRAGCPARPSGGDLSWAVRTAAVPWVVARVVVAGALVAAARVRDPGQARRWRRRASTRACWGGTPVGTSPSPATGTPGPATCRCGSSRSCPCSRGAWRLSPASAFGAALVVVANLSSLLAVALLAVLARRETGDEALARRAAWLVCLAPAAFTQVMGYAEGTLLALSVGTFLALRARAWWWAGALGLAAAATRPLGVLLIIPAVIEAVRAGAASWTGAPRAGAGARRWPGPPLGPHRFSRLGRMALRRRAGATEGAATGEPARRRHRPAAHLGA